jgi:hypothetical protein
MATKTKPPAEADKFLDKKYVARILTDGTCNAIVVTHYSTGINGGGDVAAVCESNIANAKAINAGDLSHLEGLLLAQATALQAMFVDLATRAKNQTSFEGIQTMTTLAIKCASQSRQAITALADIKLPKSVTFAKQVNQTQGPQQINNGVVSHAGKIQSEPNKLLEADHGQRMDTRAQGQAGRVNQTVDAVGQVHRAEVD